MPGGRPPGGPRFGGRQKGTLNKSTADLYDICAKNDVNIFEEMIHTLKKIEEAIPKFNALEKCAQYLYPKRKAIEFSPEMEKAMRQDSYSLMSKEDQIKALKEALSKLETS